MTTGIDKLNERIEALERATEECREATREAHSATKELRRAQKEIRDLLGADLRQVVSDALNEATTVGLEMYGETILTAMDRSVTHIQSEFHKLAKLYLEGPMGKSVPTTSRCTASGAPRLNVEGE